jgi:hypothetical protein
MNNYRQVKADKGKELFITNYLLELWHYQDLNAELFHPFRYLLSRWSKINIISNI